MARPSSEEKSHTGEKAMCDLVVGPEIPLSPTTEAENLPKQENPMKPSLTQFLAAAIISSVVGFQAVPEKKESTLALAEVTLDDKLSINPSNEPVKDQTKSPVKKVVKGLKMLLQT